MAIGPDESTGEAGPGSGQPAPPGTGRPRSRGALLVAGAAVAAVLGGVVGGLVVRATSGSGSTAATGAQTMCQATVVADKGLPSIVTISAKSGSQGGTGTGVIIRSGGYILTNNHVISVAAGGGSVSVLYSDGHTSDATIVGRDPDTDLAVIKAADGAPGFPVIDVGSSATLQVGQPVVALGAPLGLSSTVTSGIVSALDRSLAVPGDNGRNAHLVGAIQTDASINPGNSGGALVDCATALVGINTAIATVPNEAGQAGGGSVGLGFAIPVDLAMPISAELISNGSVDHPTFGMQAQTIPSAAAQAAGVPPGLFVQSVAAGGPAEAAGIRQGDIITEIDGQAVTNADALVIMTLTRRAGDTVQVTYVRGGSTTTTTTTLTLASQP